MANALSPFLYPEKCVPFWGQRLVGYKALSVTGSVTSLKSYHISFTVLSC